MIIFILDMTMILGSICSVNAVVYYSIILDLHYSDLTDPLSTPIPKLQVAAITGTKPEVHLS